MRLRFRWWGHFWRGWQQFGRGGTIVADKDYSIKAWSFFVGPIEIEWWNRKDWRDFCFTKEEADAADAEIRAEMRNAKVTVTYSPPTPRADHD